MNPFLTCSSLPHPLHRNAIRSPHRQPHRRRIWAIYAALKPSALELVHRASTFRVLGGSRQRASRWTPEYVKLLLSPRHSRGITLVYLGPSLRAKDAQDALLLNLGLSGRWESRWLRIAGSRRHERPSCLRARPS